jgi:hypothetical protein
VDLFSTNALNMSVTGRSVIQEQGDHLPDEEAYYSGGQFVERYLKPLEKYLLGCSDKCDIRLDTTVVSVARKNAPKNKSVPNRSHQPFVLLCSHFDDEYYLEVDVGEFKPRQCHTHRI